MIDLFSTISDHISTKVRQVVRPGLVKQSLRIAVLGPNLDRDDLGSRKRCQILDALKNDGHDPFFPEHEVDADNPFESVLSQESTILSQTTVDLVIVIHTATSMGVLQEIARFEGYPEIKAKTAILFPLKFYNEPGVPSDTVRNYLVNQPYTDYQLEECQVVRSCRMWASARKNGMWPKRSSYGP